MGEEMDLGPGIQEMWDQGSADIAGGTGDRDLHDRPRWEGRVKGGGCQGR